MKIWKKAVSSFLAAVTMLFAGSAAAGAAESVPKICYDPKEAVIKVSIPEDLYNKFDQSYYTADNDVLNFTLCLWKDKPKDLSNGLFSDTIAVSFLESKSANGYCTSEIPFSKSEDSDTLGSNTRYVFKFYLNDKGKKAFEKIEDQITGYSVKVTSDTRFHTGFSVYSSSGEYRAVNPSSENQAPASENPPIQAEEQTSLPEYTLEGYYTSKAKDTYEIIAGGISEKEYEYLKTCEANYKEKAHIEFIMLDPETTFYVFGSISESYSYAYLNYGSDGILSNYAKLEKDGNGYAFRMNFSLNSEEKKVFEKTQTGTMMAQFYCSVDLGSDLSPDSYNYYNGKNSYINQIAKYNFSDDIKENASSSNKVSLKKTTLTAKKSGGKITLSWKKVSGAEKYEIYYREKGDSKYKKLTTVSSGKTSYSTSKLDKSKTYQFKIRSYTELNGKKYYSSYSKVVTTK